ncbi:MAG: nodulation protein NfeD [Dehalococcoidia bacterium]|nr:nodulation protein NfeD [Dehalococcoidia bacterium]
MLKHARLIFLFIIFIVLLAVLATASVSAAAPLVVVLDFDGAVTPPLADYLDRGITKAEDDDAQACIITMDTPGGLLSSTEDIVKRIMEAKVPVVVYVDPWAGSAGTFITLAAHVAAMAPGSVIGAASPVTGGGEEISETMKKKITQHTQAWIESIAESRGRNKTAAIAAVAEAASYTDREALGLDEVEGWEALGLDSPILDPPLVDLGADSLAQLLEKIDGREVTLQSGKVVTLQTKNVVIDQVGMTTIERFLFAISDSNIAYILLSIATLGIMIELFHPGLILPGVTGGICLFLSIYSLDMLEANYAGILLMVLAFGLFVAEFFTPTFGLLTAGGIISLVLGSFILFSGTPFSIDPKLIAGVVSIFSAIFIFVVAAVIRAHRRRITTGREGLVGQMAIVQTALDPKGTVLIKGERWNAWVENGTIEPGEEVIVTKVEGLKLKVTKESKRR